MTEMVQRMGESISAELTRQCNIGAGRFHVDADTGLLLVNADLDPNGLARAAIEAIREPTEAMLAELGYVKGFDEHGLANWRAAIDAALHEQAS